MVDTEKANPPQGEFEESLSLSNNQSTESELRPRWMYKQISLSGRKLPYYASPLVQTLLVSFTCFLCPGMFNALNGLGGGGQLDSVVNNKATIALYTTFATVAFFGGSICNKLGVRLTLSLGGIGYCIYCSSFLAYNHTRNQPYVIFAGALLGICAGMLWTAQGAVLMAYPSEGQKGKYIAIFWGIFNLGAVIGALIPLGQLVNDTGNSVNDGTYIGFIVLTFLGAILAFSLCDPLKVVRKDGSGVIGMKQPTWKSELLGLFSCINSDPWIIALFPMFLASNWFYSYQFNDVNLARFNIRTRALNSLMYWIAQIIGAWVVGSLLDWSRFPRRTRALWSFIFVLLITMGTWGGGLAFQLTYTRASAAADESQKIDWESPEYAGPFVLYFFYGFFDAVWQTYVYWIMGACTNNSRKLAFFAGFYKGIQSAGQAITYGIDSAKTPYINIFAGNWALLVGSLFCALPVILTKIKDSTDAEADLVFSDETVADVQHQRPGQETEK